MPDLAYIQAESCKKNPRSCVFMTELCLLPNRRTQYLVCSCLILLTSKLNLARRTQDLVCSCLNLAYYQTEYCKKNPISCVFMTESCLSKLIFQEEPKILCSCLNLAYYQAESCKKNPKSCVFMTESCLLPN